MVLAGALAAAANLSPRLAAAMVGLGIFVSFATLPLLFRLL
jgi:malate permease and related proteins